MDGPALALLEPGNHRHIERQSRRQPARHGGLIDPGSPEIAVAALEATPRPGARSLSAADLMALAKSGGTLTTVQGEESRQLSLFKAVSGN